MKKKIWMWNHYATSMYRNRGGRHYWFANNLIKEGYDPTIFCANTFHNKNDYIETGKKKYSVDVVDNIPFVFVKTTSALGNGMDRVKNMGLFYWNLYSVVKDYIKHNGKPDVILASSVHPLTMVAGIRIAKKLGIPCICEVRDLWPEAIFSFNKINENSIVGKMLIAGEYWIYKRAQSLIFTKEGDVDYIKERKWDISQGGKIDLKKIHYINNGVDIEKFNENKIKNKIKDLDLEADLFNVIYVGAIRPVNNVGAILDAAKILIDNTDIQFLIYGEGNQKELLEERIQNEKLHNVKIKGYVNKQYIPYILSKSSVHLLNYSQNHFNWSRGNSSNKLFEYMASGKPTISTVKMGYSLINKYNCGIELEENSAEELAYAIRRIRDLNKTEYEQLSLNSLKAADEFDFKHLTGKLIKVIEGN